MCIIVIKPKGQPIPNTLETCFKNNSDGAGIMYQISDYVKIEKGFMTYEKLKQRLDALDNKLDLTNKNLIIHFRIGTSGLNDKHTTHPFPISDNEKELKMLSLKTDIGMVHNGIISEYAKGNFMSDTQHFIKDYVSMLYELNTHFLDNEKVRKVLLTESRSKLAFLDSEDKITTIGEFIEDKGILYSNTTYKEYIYTYNSNYSWDYNDYEYDNFEYKANKEKGEELYLKNNEKLMDYEDLMIIDNDMYIQKSNGELVKDNEWYAIDKDFNLYEILDFWGDFDYIVNKVDSNVGIYDKGYNEIEFVGGC